MTIKVHEYIMKTSDQEWNKKKEELPEYKRIAWQNYQTYCVKVQPNFVSAPSEEDIDENTKRRTWVLDVLDTPNGGAGAAALTFWKAIHDPENAFFNAFKTSTMNDAAFVKHKFRVTVENESNVETELIAPKD